MTEDKEITASSLIGGKTLKEIAEMPMRQATLHMREHHDPRWNVPANVPTKFTVFVKFKGAHIVEVNAISKERAIAAAEKETRSALDEIDDPEITETRIIKHEVE